MRSRLLLLFFILGTLLSLKGQNLVPNPSFENYTTCPTNIGQVSNAVSWSRPTSGTSDYYNSCFLSGSPNLDVPINFAGSQGERNGKNAYMGLVSYIDLIPNYREYLQAQLSSSLVAGETYNVEMWISVGDGAQYRTSHLGMYFSNTPVSGATNQPLPYTPQVVWGYTAPFATALGNTTNWSLLSGSFVASGGEQYITIGVYQSDAAPFLTTSLGVSGANQSAYYYIDDISVTPTTPLAVSSPSLLSFEAEKIDGQVQLNWMDYDEGDDQKYVVQRGRDGVNFEGLSHSKGGEGSSYVDEQPLFGVSYYRLVEIKSGSSAAYSEAIEINFDADAAILIYPNPATNKIFIEATEHWISPEAKLIVYNTMGEVVDEKLFIRGVQELDISSYSKGTYYIRVRSIEGVEVHKLLVKQ